MSQREIRAYGIGTYYTPSSPHAGPNASPMRGLFYLVKNNREPPVPNVVDHPWHPGRQPQLLKTPAEAYRYVAEILAACRKIAATHLAPRAPCALVPVPSSNTTRATMTTERWPALRLAEELQRQGFGRALPCVVRRQKTGSKSGGTRIEAHNLATNMEVVQRPGQGETVVYIDDSITWGSNITAIDHVLAPPGRTCALVAVFTDSVTRDAYEPRARAVRYDASHQPWQIAVENL